MFNRLYCLAYQDNSYKVSILQLPNPGSSSTWVGRCLMQHVHRSMTLTPTADLREAELTGIGMDGWVRQR